MVKYLVGCVAGSALAVTQDSWQTYIMTMQLFIKTSSS